ncbi:MAG: CAP domain-containing protein [Planctomycetota bacterium]
MSRKLAVLPVAVLLLGLALLADGPSEKDRQEYQKRLAALNAELSNAHVEVAAWCEKNALLREALRHLKEAQALAAAPSDSIAERITKIEDDLSQSPPEAPEAAYKAYEKRLEEFSKTFTKKFDELARWARQHDLADEASEMNARSRAFDPEVMIAGEKGTSRLELASWQKEGGDQLNFFRKAAGCAPVEVDLALSEGAMAHARYLWINDGSPKLDGMGVHEEKPGMPGWSDEGAKCAPNCDIWWGEPDKAVERWMATFYHRVPMLATRLAKVGMGKKDGTKLGTVLVLDCQSGVDETRADEPTIVLYPAPDQRDVPHAFAGETPDPLPAGTKGTAGYPVTFTAYDGAAHGITDVTVARLLGPDRKEVPCHLSTPQAPARADITQWNTVCLIPKGSLSGKTKYTVEITCKLGGETVEKTWSFTTK